MVTIAQQIAQKEDEIARLKKKLRGIENGQKIILGAMLIKTAQHDPKMRAWVLEEVARSVTREADKKRLEPLLEMLREIPETSRENEEETGTIA